MSLYTNVCKYTMFSKTHGDAWLFENIMFEEQLFFAIFHKLEMIFLIRLSQNIIVENGVDFFR